MLAPSGVVVPMITPVRNEDVDISVIEEFTEFLVKEGVDGLFPCGSLGEFPSLTATQRHDVIDAVSRSAPDVPVLAGCGDTSIGGVLDHIDRAYSAGADVAVVVTPYYFSPNQDGLFDFYDSIAERSPLPILMYNIPKLTGCSLSVETIVALSGKNNIIGLKDSSGDLIYHRDIIEATDDSFFVYQGPTQLAIAALDVGATGLVAGPANVFPNQIAEMYSSYRQGNRQKAVKIHNSIVNPILSVLNGIPTAIGLKYLLSLSGRDVGPPLSPLSELTEGERREIKNQYRQVQESAFL